jgi:rod shape-determining protein MreC
VNIRTAIVAAFALSLVLFGADKGGLTSWPRQIVGGALEPLQLGWYRLNQGITEKFSIITKIGSLSGENLSLSAENDFLKAELAKLGTVKADNDSLRKQLGTVETKSFKLLTSDTLGFVPAAGKKELILAAGRADGVRVGQAVVSGNVVLGKISSVEADKSTLTLLTDPESTLLVATSRGAKGILTGQFQSTAKLSKVLLEETLNVGDTVLTTGEGDWPPRLVVGEVIKVTRGDLFQEADVRPLANYEKLQLVSIILGGR